MNSVDKLMAWLQNWFSDNCKKTPSQIHHIIIMTIDNPGWGVTINLTNLFYDQESYLIEKTHDENNWYYCVIKNNNFEGDGGLFNLKNILSEFIEKCNVTYEKTHTGTDVAWLLEWFASQCDGDWEHGKGIRINTIDNPGWSLFINLEETELEKKEFAKIEIARSESDWITCHVCNQKFEGCCGANNLLELVHIFRAWAE